MWALSSRGSEIAVDATAYRDSSSEKITLGSVARLRRGKPGESWMDAGDSGDSGERCVSASWRLCAERGLLRFADRFSGGGTARNGRPRTGPALLIGVVENADSDGCSSTSSAWLCLFRLKILRITVFKVLPVRRWAIVGCEWKSMDGSAVS
jgi:hypothetical protein